MKFNFRDVDETTRDRQKKAFERMEQEKADAIEKERPYLLVVSNSNVKRSEIHRWSWKSLEENESNSEALRRLRKWTPDKTWGLFIHGSIGSGKTHLLKGFQITWALRGVTSRFYSLAELSNEFRRHMFDGGDLNAFIHKLHQTDIIIVDDVGAENTTDFVQSQFLVFLDQRIAKGKSIFCSSNYAENELAGIYGGRIMDRISAMMSYVECSGDSYRKKLNKEIEKEFD